MNSNLKNPLLMEEFFNIINSKLKDDGKLPDILDYCTASGSSSKLAIRSYELNVNATLMFGNCEGEFVDVSLWGDIGCGEKKEYHLGSYKTLQTSADAMHTLGILAADFVFEATKYINDHLDDFDWQGYEVEILNEDGTVYPVHPTGDDAEKLEERSLEKMVKLGLKKAIMYNKNTHKVYKNLQL